MFGHRLRRWPNIKSILGQRLVFAGNSPRSDAGSSWPRDVINVVKALLTTAVLVGSVIADYADGAQIIGPHNKHILAKTQLHAC